MLVKKNQIKKNRIAETDYMTPKSIKWAYSEKSEKTVAIKDLTPSKYR